MTTAEMQEFVIHHVKVECNGKMYRSEIGTLFNLFRERFNVVVTEEEEDVERIVRDIFLPCLKGYRSERRGIFYTVRPGLLK